MSEILAPAGSPESVFAAVRCGADAVYLAGEAFNARRNADNFSYEQLKEAVAYCHARGVKVYHALNTLVKDSEISALKEEIERILTLGEDALILQDLGLVRIVKSLCPTMPIHASTQLTAHSPAAVHALEEMGFRRVVLAREMSLQEIEEIRRSTSLELEVFVHGALCMCVSGQCLMSAFLGARSGNRGLCAQPCRLPFSAAGGTGYDLSLKDNSLLEHLQGMEALGVDSFKIEGRMKRPEYVAAAVLACKEALNGTYTPERKQQLKSIFSRQGFTDAYYTATRGKAMFGSRTHEDVTAADNHLLKEYAATYAKETARVACDMYSCIRANRFPTLRLRAAEKEIEVTGDAKPEAAIHRSLEKEEVAQRLSKLGGTPFFAREIHIDLDDGLMLSAGEINRLRRSAVQALEQTLAQPKPLSSTGELPPLTQRTARENKQLYLRFADISQVPQAAVSFDKIILPIEQASQAAERFGTQKLILETPRVFFGLEQKLKRLLEQAKALGVRQIAVGNIGALQLAKEYEFQTLAFLGTNIFNSHACAQIAADEILLSPEMSTAQIAALQSPVPCGSILYGHIPLMITRNCPIRNGRSCSQCARNSSLRDRKGETLPVRCRFGASEIFNAHPLYMIDKENELRTDFSVLYFTTENAAQVQHILKLNAEKAKADFGFTRGLYPKGVL